VDKKKKNKKNKKTKKQNKKKGQKRARTIRTRMGGACVGPSLDAPLVVSSLLNTD
jgi:hypothetical protein